MKNITTILLVLFTIFASAQVDMDSILITNINDIRTNPKSFIPLVEKYISYQERDLKSINDGTMEVTVFSGAMNSSNKMVDSKTSTGIDVINAKINASKELIEILSTMEPLERLYSNVDMELITNEQGKFLDSTRTRGHFGPNGETLSNRFKDLNVFNISENVGSLSRFNYKNKNFNPMLLDMLIDAFEPTKGHRNNLLNPEFRFISVYVSDFVSIQNFAK